MWFSFFFASAIGLLLLYGVGFFFFRTLNLPKTEALICAPVFTIAFLCCMGVIFACLGITINKTVLLAVFLALLALLVALDLVLSFRRKKALSATSASESIAPSPHKKDPLNKWGYCLLYLIIGLIIVGFCFVKCLDSPSSFVQTYDNVFHYNVTESFMSSGIWSIFNVDDYLGLPDSTYDPFQGASFYPAAWHIFSSAIGILSNVPATEATNVANFIFLFAVFPLNVFLLLKTIFPSNKKIAFLGAFVSLSIFAFPWSLYSVWPLFPNVTSLCILPIVLSAFILFFSKQEYRGNRSLISLAVVFFIGSIALFTLQPNTIFAAVVFLIPFCVWRIFESAKDEQQSADSKNSNRKTLQIILPLVFLAFVAIIWCVLFKLPFLQATINYYWPPLLSKAEAIRNILDMSFLNSVPSYVVAVLTIIGALYALIKKRKALWLAFSYLFVLVLFFVAVTQEDTFIKHFLTGFWYTDPYRLASMCGLFAIPLATLGLFALASLICKVVNKNHLKKKTCCISVAVAIVFSLAAYWPFTEDAPFYNLRSILYSQGDPTNAFLNRDEEAFLQDVKQVIPEKALIINQPFDGSLFAYSFSEVNIYYRSVSGYDGTKESADSTTIRNSLNQISYNEQVQNAVKKTGAEYVLLFDVGNEDIEPAFPTYHKVQWQGVNQINDNTPGFEIVLQKDNMRLYKIVV